MNHDSGWAAEKNFWRELEKSSDKLTWKRVPLDLSRQHLVSKSTGVYLICAPPPDGIVSDLRLYTVLYAGQVHSKKHGLRARFREHVKKPSPKLRVFNDCYYPNVDFWFTRVSDQKQIGKIEALLIEIFNPPCNSIRAPRTQPLIARLGKRVPIRSGSESLH